MSADEPPPQQKQGDVHQQDEQAHRQKGNIGVDGLAQAGDAPQGDLVGGIEPVKGQGVQQRAHGDPGIGREQLFRGLGVHEETLLSLSVRLGENQDRSRVIWVSPRSSSFSRAPFTGRERAR